jgi:hypothetical protein
MSIVLVGSTSGSVTLQEPAVAGTTVLDLPATSGNVVVDSATQTLTNKTLTSPTLTTPNINSAQFATVSGTAPIYPCRAWVNFNGTTNTGGFCTIRGSGNVTTVADRGTGLYTINFTTAMPDANYCGVASATIGGASNANRSAAVGPIDTLSAYCNSWSDDGGVAEDVAVICASIFR